MIPKIIHYCWFGGNEKSELINKCIDSWKKYCPDWEIREWNEYNMDLSEYPYMQEAFDMQKWVFVSDVARLKVVHNVGGIYLDTDVELFCSLDNLIQHKFFCVFESECNIATGLGFGAEKGHNYVKAMLDFYKDRHFIINGKVNMQPCPASNTVALRSLCNEMIRNGQTQRINEGIILSMKDYNTFAFHHGEASWVEKTNYKRKPYKDTKLKRFLRQAKFFDYIETRFGNKALKIYTFIVYDFLEMGLIYYLKRIIEKILGKRK